MNKFLTLGFLALLSTSALAQPAFNGPINYAGAGGSSTGGGTGTVTSVGLALPSIITVTGSPVTTSGTLTGTLATQPANTVFSGPTTGAAATPTFRALVAADLPAGTGTVTSITAGNGISLSTNPCVTTCTASTTVTVNTQTGTTYPLATTDGGQVVSANNASSQAYSLSAASTAGFTSGYGFDLYGIGAGAVTLTAATSNFDNALHTLVINQGQDAFVWSDGANYHAMMSLPVMATNTYLGNTSGSSNYPTAQSMASGVAAFLATPSSANLATALTDETGTGAVVFAGSPAFTGTVTAAALTLSGTFTTNLTGGGTQCAQVSNTGVLSGTGSGCGAAGVSSITGTANQITASASTGAVTLSIPAVAQIATSLAVSGCTIGVNALCSAGSISGSTTILAGASSNIGLNGRGVISSPGAGFIQLGVTNSGTPIAQTLGAQSGSGTNIAGQLFIIQGSLGTGNASSGGINFNTGGAVAASGATAATSTNAMSIAGVTGLVALPLISSDATHTDASICEDTTTHALYSGSGTLGICLGTSSARYKHGITDIAMGLPEIMSLKPKSFYLNKGHGDPKKQMYGFLAEDVVKVLPKLVNLDSKGRPNTADYLGLVPILVKAIQQQQVEITILQKQLAAKH